MATQLDLTVEQLLAQALHLPVDQRIELGETLIDSVDEEDPSALETAWAAEMKRRAEEIDSGEAEMAPTGVVLAHARARVEQVASAPGAQVLAQALQLPIQQRIELGQALFASVDSEDEDEDPEEVEAAWAEEIKRRVEEIRDGSAETIPAEEVFAEMRARFG